MEVEKLRADRGLFSPKFVYERSLVQLEILTSTDTLNHPLYSSFKNKIAEISINEAQANDLLKNLEKAINESFKPTYTELTELIRLHSQNAREHDGVWSMPNGEDYYKHRLKIYTTTDYSTDEIHEIGLKLVAFEIVNLLLPIICMKWLLPVVSWCSISASQPKSIGPSQ